MVRPLTLPSVDRSPRDLGSPSTDFPPRRARAETHMMKAVTPMAQMSVCGTAPWPSRSSGAGDGTGGGHRLFVVEGAGGQDWGLLPAPPSPRSGLVSAPCAPMVSM